MLRINSSVFSRIRDFNLVFIRNTILISVLAVIYLNYIFIIISANCKIICFCKCVVVNGSFTFFTDYSIIEFCIYSFITFQYFITILINMLNCIFLICFLPLRIKGYRRFHSKLRIRSIVDSRSISLCIPSDKYIAFPLWKSLNTVIVFYLIFISCYYFINNRCVITINISKIPNFNFYIFYIAIHMRLLVILFFY